MLINYNTTPRFDSQDIQIREVQTFWLAQELSSKLVEITHVKEQTRWP